MVMKRVFRMYKNFYLLKSIKCTAAVLFVFGVSLVSFSYINYAQQEEQQPPPVTEGKINLLKLLDLQPSKESIDFILNRTQAQHQTLVTEQSHQKTTYLSDMTKKDFEIVIDMLVSVDEDILRTLRDTNKEKLYQMAEAFEETLSSGNKIYIYDSSSSGWTSKTIESVFWRPFWKKAKQDKKIWEKVTKNLPENIEISLIGETTGGDMALLSPVDLLEEFQVMGKLDIVEHNIGSNDVVIGVSESGDEAAVIGTLISALDQRKKDKAHLSSSQKNKIFFIYNNPDEKLLLNDLSRRILKATDITRVNLTTGPQAVAGHTAMQASTINTFVLGNILQTAVFRILQKFLSGKEMSKIGFEDLFDLDKNLNRFSELIKQIKKAVPDLAALSRLESETYNAGHMTTYIAGEGLFTTFVHAVGRNGFFYLHPFDTVKTDGMKSKLQIWSPAQTPEDAWTSLLGRPYKPVDWDFYTKFLSELTDDLEFKNQSVAIIEKIKSTSQDQYDFSYGNFNLVNRAPKAADLGVLIFLSPEAEKLESEHSAFFRFLDLFQGRGAYTAVIFISEEREKEFEKTISLVSRLQPKGPLIKIRLENNGGSFNIDQQIVLKMLLDIHSAAVMAGAGEIIGNTPSEATVYTLKQIDRATSLIQSYVNQTLRHPQWVKKYGVHNPINYGETNAVLFDSLKYLKNTNIQDSKERIGVVTLSTIRILESLRTRKSKSLEEALNIAGEKGLALYLSEAEK